MNRTILAIILAMSLGVAGCGRQLRQDAASALDSARRLHAAGCIEAPLLPAQVCADELRKLLDLEPRIEAAQSRALDRLRQLLALAKPHAFHALRNALEGLQLPYPLPTLAPALISYLEASLLDDS